MKLHHYNEAYAHMVRRTPFANGSEKPTPRTFQDKLSTLKEASRGLDPESTLRLFDFYIQEALTKGELTEQQASGIYQSLPQAEIKETIETFERENFSGGTKLMDEYLGAQKEYQKAVDNGFQGTYEEFLRFKSSGSFQDGGRAGYQDGLSVQTLDPRFPTKDPKSTGFKPLDIPGAVLPPLAIGAGIKRFKDIFLSKDKDDDKKEIVPSDDKKPNIEPPEDPLGDAISSVELATTAKDIKKIVEDFRAQKTSPGSSQPKMTNFEKSQLLNLVVDKFKKDQGTLPSFTQVKNLLPGFPNLPEIIKYSQLELPKQKADYDRSDPVYIKTMEDKAQGKALEGNTISIFGQKNFYPETVTLPNGDVVNAKTFFEENFAKRVQLGPGRQETKKVTLNNNELAKIFNTNVRKIEKATKIIKDSPDFKAEYPPVRPANYGNLISIERLKEARKYLTESELTNIKSQEQQLNNLNTMFKTGELVVTDFPNLVKAINTTLDKETGKLDFSIKKTDEQMIKRSKNNDGLFDISHTIPKTSKQKNIEFLRNRNILDYKTNQGLFKSFEAYVRNKKDDPEYDLRLNEFDKYMKEMGQRVKIGNRFFGLDEKMFDSNTGEHTGINRALEYFGLPKFENGVPLKTKKAEGGSVYGKYAGQIAKLS